MDLMCYEYFSIFRATYKAVAHCKKNHRTINIIWDCFVKLFYAIGYKFSNIFLDVTNFKKPS